MISTSFKNQVGIEFEYFLKDVNGEFVFPNKYGFQYDEFCLLGEVRVLPDDSPEKVFSNFITALYSLKESARKQNLTVVTSGVETISNTLYKEALKLMGCKELPECKNIYGTDIMDFDDKEVDEKGVCIKRYITAGLHIHFSSLITKTYTYPEVHLEQCKLPKFKLADGLEVTLEPMFKVKPSTEVKDEVSYSRITNPVVFYFVKEFDDKILPKYTFEKKFKYRFPGFYELKSYGFEYRSLPFNDRVIYDMWDIINFSFHLFDSL